MTSPTTASVDLNCDMGESYGAWRMGDDETMLDFVSSANVACGFHAGDPHVMARTFKAAAERGVAVGAHPGYPDLQGFGRRTLDCTPAEIEHFVAYQIGAAQAVSKYAGNPIRFVKPHGALANVSQVDAAVAGAIVRAIAAVDPGLVLLTFADGEARRIAQEMGIRVCAEIFADRAYTERGELVSRKLPGSVLHDPAQVADRVLRMVQAGAVETQSGKMLPCPIESICVHGDSPGAVAMAKAVREKLEGAGVAVRPFALAR
ncbi:LamB/YcsF family protein [Ramlibacter sp.]|uniref:LamB/YcsF family protein n=1 Tax=Ramlibacter sp. TaxID=1917967 RepID=UPI003D0E4A20